MDLLKSELKINCPKCHTDNVLALGQAHNSTRLTCVECGVVINLSDDGSAQGTVKEVNRSLNSISKRIKEINKKLNI